MAQQQQNISLTAPGFFGLNLEDAPIDIDQRFALRADNAVIDRFGRLGARKGLKPLLDSSPHADGDVRSIARVVDNGVERVIAGVYIPSLDENQIWEIQNISTNPTAIAIPLPVGYTLTDSNVQIFDFAGYGAIVGGGEMLLLRNGSLSKLSDGPLILPQDDSGNLVAVMDPTNGTAAYGRLWVSGGSLGEETIHYCNLNNPYEWYDGKAVPTNTFNTGGLVDVFEYWPNGRDRIIDLAAHNNMLVVFGRSSILIYGNPQGDPAAEGGLYLADTIKGIGLVDRDALTSDGKDLLFVDDTGLRSLGRTIQEQSAAIGDLTRPVRKEYQDSLKRALIAGGVELVYDPSESFILTILRGSNDVWVCDTRMPMQDGSLRTTRWPGQPVNCGYYDDESERLVLGLANKTPMVEYIGNTDYVGLDDEGPFNFVYWSPVLSFGDPVRSKFVKQIDFTVVSGIEQATSTAAWEYVGVRPYEKLKFFKLQGGEANYYGNDGYLYNVAKYGEGDTVIRSYKVNADGSGENVIVKFSTQVNNSICSLQQINIQSLLGRII